jgi:hypothetical protein
MSTATVERIQPKQLGARPMASLRNIGRVSSVGEASFTESKFSDQGNRKPNYIKIPLEFSGINGSKDGRTMILIRPEWFKAEFDPNSDLEVDGNPCATISLDVVYRKNLGAADAGIGLIQVLGGSPEGADELFTRLYAAFKEATTEVDGQENIDLPLISDTIRNFIQEVNPVVGYTLVQRREKAGIDPETGKNVYVRKNQYEVGESFERNGFFYPTHKEISRLSALAAKSNDRYKVAFDTELPF